MHALIAVDEDDLVIGASRSARHLLGLTDEVAEQTIASL